MSNDHGEKNPSLLANTVALIGLIILAVIVIWGLLHLGSLSSNWLSSLFPSSSTSISVTAPKSTTADSAFTLGWKFNPSTTGTYALVYQCVPGATLGLVGDNGAVTRIPCGAAYTLGSATSSVLLVPQLNATTTASVPLSVVFMPSTATGKQARGSATVGVYAAALPTPIVTTTAPAATITTTNTTHISSPSTNSGSHSTSPADLAVRIVSVNAGNPASVTFDISNVGGSPTGTYYFTANLPTEDGYVYSSSAQASLNPGDHVSNTLTFSPVAASGGSISIHVGNSTGANNYAQQWIGGNGYVGAAATPTYFNNSYNTSYTNTYPTYAPTNYAPVNYDSNYYNPSGNPQEQWSYDRNQNYDYQYNQYSGANPSYPSYPTYYPAQTNYGYGNDVLYPPTADYGYGQDYGYTYQY